MRHKLASFPLSSNGRICSSLMQMVGVCCSLLNKPSQPALQVPGTLQQMGEQVPAPNGWQSNNRQGHWGTPTDDSHTGQEGGASTGQL